MGVKEQIRQQKNCSSGKCKKSFKCKGEEYFVGMENDRGISPNAQKERQGEQEEINMDLSKAFWNHFRLNSGYEVFIMGVLLPVCWVLLTLKIVRADSTNLAAFTYHAVYFSNINQEFIL